MILLYRLFARFLKLNLSSKSIIIIIITIIWSDQTRSRSKQSFIRRKYKLTPTSTA